MLSEALDSPVLPALEAKVSFQDGGAGDTVMREGERALVEHAGSEVGVMATHLAFTPAQKQGAAAASMRTTRKRVPATPVAATPSAVMPLSVAVGTPVLPPLAPVQNKTQGGATIVATPPFMQTASHLVDLAHETQSRPTSGQYFKRKLGFNAGGTTELVGIPATGAKKRCVLVNSDKTATGSAWAGVTDEVSEEASVETGQETTGNDGKTRTQETSSKRKLNTTNDGHVDDEADVVNESPMKKSCQSLDTTSVGPDDDGPWNDGLDDLTQEQLAEIERQALAG